MKYEFGLNLFEIHSFWYQIRGVMSKYKRLIWSSHRKYRTEAKYWYKNNKMQNFGNEKNKRLTKRGIEIMQMQYKLTFQGKLHLIRLI